MDVSRIPAGHNPPWDINVIIEVPLGGEPVKYELDKGSGAMFVDRFLHTSMRYPCNYGFVPHTLAADGDPVDVLVAARTPSGVSLSSWTMSAMGRSSDPRCATTCSASR